MVINFEVLIKKYSKFSWLFLGILSLGPGAPGSQYYPFDSFTFKSPSVGNFAEAQLEDSGMTLRTNKYDRKAGSSIYGE